MSEYYTPYCGECDIFARQSQCPKCGGEIKSRAQTDVDQCKHKWVILPEVLGPYRFCSKCESVHPEDRENHVRDLAAIHTKLCGQTGI